MEKFKNVGELMFLSGFSKTYHVTIASLSKRKNRYSFCHYCSWKSQRKTTEVKKQGCKRFQPNQNYEKVY